MSCILQWCWQLSFSVLSPHVSPWSLDHFVFVKQQSCVSIPGQKAFRAMYSQGKFPTWIIPVNRHRPLRCTSPPVQSTRNRARPIVFYLRTTSWVTWRHAVCWNASHRLYFDHDADDVDCTTVAGSIPCRGNFFSVHVLLIYYLEKYEKVKNVLFFIADQYALQNKF